MSDESDERELEERLAEVEAENNAIKEYLGKLVENGPSRRQVLKSGATVAGAGMLGFSVGNASAQASTEDGDGNVGDPDDRVDVFADGVDSNTAEIADAVEITESAANLIFNTDPNENLGTHNIRFQAAGSTTLNAVYINAKRLLVDRQGHTTHGGFPGLEMYNSDHIALRPADSKRSAMFWDRSDHSKEFGLIAESGAAKTDRTAFLQANRAINLQAGAHVRGETWAPRNDTSHGISKFHDDFLGALRNEWEHQGNGSFRFFDTTENGGAGALALETDGTDGQQSAVNFDGTLPFELGRKWRLRMLFRGDNGGGTCSPELGLKEDSDNYARIDTDASGNIIARNANGGTVTSTDLTEPWNSGEQHIIEIEHDPTAGELTYGVGRGRVGNYPLDTDVQDNTATHTTNIPSGYAEPELSIVADEAAAKRVQIDYVLIQQERVTR